MTVLHHIATTLSNYHQQRVNTTDDKQQDREVKEKTNTLGKDLLIRTLHIPDSVSSHL
jgi:hypothetical protein